MNLKMVKGAGACIAAFGITFGVTAAGGFAGAGPDAVAEQSDHPTGEAPFVVSRAPAEPLPQLSGDDRATVANLLEKSPLVVRILDDEPFELREMGVWTSESGEKVGAVVWLELDRELSIPKGIPVLAAAPRDAEGNLVKRPANVRYEAEPAPFSASAVTSLTAFVDLSLGEVVAVHPGPDSKVEYDKNYLETVDSLDPDRGGE